MAAHIGSQGVKETDGAGYQDVGAGSQGVVRRP